MLSQWYENKETLLVGNIVIGILMLLHSYS